MIEHNVLLIKKILSACPANRIRVNLRSEQYPVNPVILSNYGFRLTPERKAENDRDEVMRVFTLSGSRTTNPLRILTILAV
ncbi:MAG: hypothetical protein ACE5HI_00260 [bacterium]